MKVYHHERDQTFSLSELESAINLIRNQYGLRSAIMQAHDDAQEDHPDLIEELRDDLCPACAVVMFAEYGLMTVDCINPYMPRTAFPKPTTVTSTESVTVQLADSPVRAPQAQKVAAPLPHALEQAAAPPVAQVLHAPQAASSASSRWYTVTAGHVTGVFQGWHNVHPHVIGVPGACFGRHPSRAAAEEAYAQAQASSDGV
ncbi:hypothetical protein M405DRAFT_839047 [Rhizopogon salebrosus TDB-379]|nr:hypothetical protein M405DRAFT_839047 [Rhizopogon salebrosus TDB-379]